ncbi:LysM peptidoglycan-binding domain-containing protein [Latilactobacillus fuchuensis]|uniref:LysM domain protein n=2 Tax=Latilactobacillus fuchuensis TaxID=164393 RepID=A0A2N9DVK1_9LACO|nr:LysM domain-containing protein [Latilactobacillus fuchuensis]KRL58412.1 lysM domain protein [Latilactobacillus fuchuensis DSM 14340 = JCM 11249]SPC38554.1 LysM domain protein [Latilactobacillus fuchuensis]
MLKDDKKKTDNQTEDKPWETQFDDDRDAKGNLSRVASKSKEKGNTYFAIILGVLLVLMIAFPIIAYTVHSSRANKPVEESSKIVVDNTDSSSAKKAAKKSQSISESKAKVASEDKAKAASESSAKAASDEQAAAASSSQAAAESQQAASASQAAADSSSAAETSSSSSESATGTYTLKSGEGLYRAAVNNGMTLDQLLALNPGLTSSSSVAPGTQLNIK